MSSTYEERIELCINIISQYLGRTTSKKIKRRGVMINDWLDLAFFNSLYYQIKFGKPYERNLLL